MFGHLYLYIPIWFYSNISNLAPFIPNFHLYIPIWFYSNDKFEIIKAIFNNFTFQSGSIQIGNSSELSSGKLPLYIPIWFYSNTTVPMPAVAPVIFFTFQSGSIQMVFFKNSKRICHTFTFQSGSIQMEQWQEQRLAVQSLHSNLVLFK